MANLCCITKDLWKSKLSDFRPFKGKLSREDVATLLETFEFAQRDVPVEVISDVLINSQRFFAFLVDSECDGSFDFYKFINDNFSGSVSVNCINGKFMFPKALSKGIYSEYEVGEEAYSDGQDAVEEESMEDDEGKTGFMDEEELNEIMGISKYFLYYKKVDYSLPITNSVTIIGRSRKQSDYVIQGNTNVSRSHAKVYLKDGEPCIEDDKSANGTFVNGTRVKPGEVVRLNVGDVVMLAEERFVVVE